MIKTFVRDALSILPENIRAMLVGGPDRSVRAKKNIAAMFALRGVSILVGFLLVPMTLHYLNPTKYGIWLTLSSVFGWLLFFDVGLGNGMRNKFAEAMAKNDVELARSYVSTTYLFLGAIILVIFIIFMAVNPFLNWPRILNVESDVPGDLSALVLITFGFFCLRFVFGLINSLLIADQKPALNSMLDVLSSLVSLALVGVLLLTTSGSLLLLGSAVGFSTAIVPIVASVWLYHGKYRHVRPSLSYVKTAYAADLIRLGVKFFLLQIAFVIVFSTSNIIITQLFSPADVVPYNLAYKYYSIITMVFGIILFPFWSAYTEAYVRDDTAWILKTIGILKKIWYLMVVGVVLMTVFADLFYRYWVGTSVTVPFSISLTMGVYVLIGTWSNIYVNFINGTGKVQLQTLSAIAVSILNIPLAIVFVRIFGMGIGGVILAPCVCLLPWVFVWPIQVKRILSKTATGVWAK